MGRAPASSSSSSSGLKKGPWTADEDVKLREYIERHGAGNWRTVPQNAGLQRCGKSCRLRWTNYLRPDIKRGRFSFEEEEAIIQLHSLLGNKWSAIAARLPGRTDNEIKNYWNTHIRRRLLRMGLDPVTHAPRLHHHHHLPYSTSHLNDNLSNLLFFLNQQQQMVNPQLLNNIATTLLALNQQPNQTLFNDNSTHVSEDEKFDAYVPQIHNDHQFQPYNSSSFLPSNNQHAGGFSTSSSMDDLSAHESWYGFSSNNVDGCSQMLLPPLVDDEKAAATSSSFGSLNNNHHHQQQQQQQQLSTYTATPFTSYTSSPLDSSYTSNGFSTEDEIDSILNFEIPDLTELLY